jgi:hypothetical protein
MGFDWMSDVRNDEGILFNFSPRRSVAARN